MKTKTEKKLTGLISRVFSPLRIFRFRRADTDLKSAAAAHRASSLFAPTFQNNKWNR